MILNEQSQTISAVIQNLRDLFKDKDRLSGIDDWDNFLGCIITLEGVIADLDKEAQEVKENPKTEGE